MNKILAAVTSWLFAKALAALMAGIMLTVLIVGIVTSDVGEIKLSWKLYDIPEGVKHEK